METNQTQHELLVIVLDRQDPLPDVLDGLYEAGVPGVTILDSVGGYRARNWLEEIGLGGLSRLFGVSELRRRTLLAVMPSELIDGAIAAAEKAVGGFGKPESGLLFTVPVGRTIGLIKREIPEHSISEPVVSPMDINIREMPVAKAMEMMVGDRIVVRSNASLAEVAAAMMTSPPTHVAAVVSRTDHLLGLVTLRDLADRVFFGIMPELFYKEVHDREQAEAFGQMAAVRTAADFMISPVAVHVDDPVRVAFRLMHENELSGLPVVDDDNHVIGFVNLLELLSLALGSEGESA
ncbi:MAG: CBS domain-containing protein [Caldilineales bacterium]|nr:CBS domain-containing protein [Caldilineales bacterium]